MLSWLTEPQAWLALATLTALEIVLGIDNIIFITIVVRSLPEERRDRARILGLALAMGTRIALLISITWLMSLKADLFTVFGQGISGRDLILLLGGLFLLWKSVHEIHGALEGPESHEQQAIAGSFVAVLVQIALIDIVFSLDSVITAVGMAQHVPVMVIAIILAVLVMMAAASAIGDFVERHPTVKMLALAFLVLVGVALIADCFDVHIPRGYVYFAMGFSVGVEMLNLRARQKRRQPRPIKLRGAASDIAESDQSGR